jgi:predicted dehydrogenase
VARAHSSRKTIRPERRKHNDIDSLVNFAQTAVDFDTIVLTASNRDCDILVTEPTHPYIDKWWPPGHIIGYEHTFIHTIADFVKAVIEKRRVQPTFEDGLRNQKILEAAAKSAASDQELMRGV